MKLICDQADLEQALNIVSKAITPNTTLPVLNNILLKAEKGKIYFSATNLEVAIQYFFHADIQTEGEITVPAKLISSYISLIKDEKIELFLLENDTLQIKSPSSHTKIKGINALEFPVIPVIEKQNTIKIQRKDMDLAIMQTVFAASLNTSRPTLSGVLFDVNNQTLTIVATDSYRLAEKKIHLQKGTDLNIQCIIPARTIIELGKILDRSKEEEIELNICQNQVLFIIGDIQLMSRLIEGKFPPYEKIIPKETKTKLEVNAEELSNVARRVSLFARENNNSVKVLVEDGKLIIATDETKIGEERAEIHVKTSGDDNKISLNAQYLLDVLNFIQCDTVIMEIDDKLSPVVIKSLKETDYTYIIMPLKI